MQTPVLMWFRQDLRLSDHSALTAAAAKGPVIPLFILDDETPGEWKWGGASRWWLHQSLLDFQTKVPLLLRRGKADDVLRNVLKASGAEALYFTRDYAPWSGALEHRIKTICDELGIACHRHGGFLLHEPESIRNGSGEPYKVYTPFARACFGKGEPRAVKPAPKIEFATHALKSDALDDWKLLPTKPDWANGLRDDWQPGEQGAQKLLHHFIDEGLSNYSEGRDRPDKKFTSRLSPHLHWGEISPHQVWHTARTAMAQANGALDNNGEKFLKEILWREFSYQLLHHWPDFPEQPFKKEFANFPWQQDVAGLAKWQRGQTGFPIVDAGMRELWHTGLMHNRVRMITASFLIKDLLIPWQTGERWFWDTLVDADIASNSASWQWVAGSGADASPYYRIFNPVLQGQKFDPDGAYVKKWIPELASVPTEFIHCPWDMPVPPKAYARPMVNHGEARNRALAALKTLKNVS